MNLKVCGPRLLVKVHRFSENKDNTYEGTSILMAEQVKTQETTSQSIGEVVQLGDMAYQRKDAGCDGTPWVKVGDTVHFSRYGAMRINIKSSEEHEYWVLMDKDILVIEEATAETQEHVL